IYQEYEKLADMLIDAIDKDDKFIFYHYMIDLNNGPCVYKRISGCGSGSEYMAVTPTGELFPCHQFVGNDEFKIGDVFEGIKKEEIIKDFKKNNLYSQEKCKDCWAQMYCSGGCAANNYNAGGDINKIYDYGCKVFKKRIEMALAVKIHEFLKENEKNLDGLVKIFFQPGEEIPGGAKPMIDEGCMENPKVDRVIGLHEGGIFGHLPTGTVGDKEDAMMASMDAFILKVKGHGGHGARPENFIDPIITISEINLALQKIISRELDPTNSALISICQIHGGTCQNIIPNEVWEEGTVRTHDENVRDFVEKRIKEISENIARAFRCEAELDYKRYYPAVINDKEFTSYVKNIAKE
ncbi:MAG: amidohydrolase, partial [Anaerococcus sp.]|nr:amidohydrolase [Anaerococcus sp.]